MIPARHIPTIFWSSLLVGMLVCSSGCHNKKSSHLFPFLPGGASPEQPADTIAPTTPTALQATAINEERIDLTWNASADAGSASALLTYDVCYSLTADACTNSFAAGATTPAGATAATITGLTPSTKYYLAVRARDAAGNLSPISAEASATTAAPGAVTAPTFSPSAGTFGGPQSVTISSSTAGATICHTQGPSPSDPACDAAATCTAGSTPGGSLSITSSTTVKAMACLAGTGSSTINTAAYVIDTDGPSTPTGLTATVIHASQIDVSWTAAADNTTEPGSLVYEVCIAAVSGGCSSFIASVSTAPGSTSHSATGLLPLTAYYFAVRARDAFGHTGPATAEQTATTAATGTVSTPTFSPASGSFNAATDVTISSLTETATICHTSGAAPNDPSCAPSGNCSLGTAYTGAVSLSDSATVKAIACRSGYTPSAVASATYTIDSAPPTPPASPAVSSPGPEQLTVTWIQSLDNVTASSDLVYEICISTTAGACASFTASYSTTAGASSYTISGLQANTPYYIRVRARDALNNYSGSSTQIQGSWQFSPSVVIYEIYGSGSATAAPYQNDYVLLHNRNGSTVNLSGWSLQYASSTGTSWTTTPLSGSVAAGGYYLIQLNGGISGSPLPTPDVTGSTNMAGSAGKVALMRTTAALTGSSPSGADVEDFVGYGTANGYEGSGAAPTLSASLAGRRIDPCVDTNDNLGDFQSSAPAPVNSTAAPLVCH